jgi:hypothetical protein
LQVIDGAGGGGGGGGATRELSSFFGSTLIVNAIADVLSSMSDIAQVSISLFIRPLYNLIVTTKIIY